MGVIGHPYHAAALPDGRVFLVYGYRHPPFGIRARLLDPECRRFDTPELVLRDDGGGGDLGYPWACVTAGWSRACRLLLQPGRRHPAHRRHIRRDRLRGANMPETIDFTARQQVEGFQRLISDPNRHPLYPDQRHWTPAVGPDFRGPSPLTRVHDWWRPEVAGEPDLDGRPRPCRRLSTRPSASSAKAATCRRTSIPATRPPCMLTSARHHLRPGHPTGQAVDERRMGARIHAPPGGRHRGRLPPPVRRPGQQRHLPAGGAGRGPAGRAAPATQGSCSSSARM